MIKLTEEQIVEAQAYIKACSEKYDFSRECYPTMFPSGLTHKQISTRINMFLCIGISSTAQTKTNQSLMIFIKRGVRRFFRSLNNRRELAEFMFAKNEYFGRYSLTCDYYVAPAVFGDTVILDSTLAEWNRMMSSIVIKGNHGIKVKKSSDLYYPVVCSDDQIKYEWVNKRVRKKTV